MNSSHAALRAEKLAAFLDTPNESVKMVKTELLTLEKKGVWERFVANHPMATIYHNLEWKTIFGNSFHYRSWYLIAYEQSSGEVIGCLPLFLVESPFSRKLVSVPFRDRGGILWSRLDAIPPLIEMALGVAKAVGATSLLLKSIEPYPKELVRQMGLKESWYWINSRIDLSQLDSRQFQKKIGFKTRNKINQARRGGLELTIVSPGSSMVDKWQNLHVKSQKNLGLPPFPRKFFELMFEQHRKRDQLELFLISSGSIPVAGAILLIEGKQGIYAYSASDPGYRHLRPNDLLLFCIVEWLIERKIPTLDLGSDAPSQVSLLQFKKKWLSTQKEIPEYFWGDFAFSDSSSLPFTVIRKAFCFLPTPVLKLLGSVGLKFFG